MVRLEHLLAREKGGAPGFRCIERVRCELGAAKAMRLKKSRTQLRILLQKSLQTHLYLHIMRFRIDVLATTPGKIV
jgi:hypothetical protein